MRCCPSCGATRQRSKGMYRRRLRHENWGLRHCFLEVEAQKWRCLDCGRQYRQRLPDLQPCQRSSEAFRMAVYFQHLDGINRSCLGRREGMGAATVERHFRRGLQRQPRLAIPGAPPPSQPQAGVKSRVPRLSCRTPGHGTHLGLQAAPLLAPAQKAPHQVVLQKTHSPPPRRSAPVAADRPAATGPTRRDSDGLAGRDRHHVALHPQQRHHRGLPQQDGNHDQARLWLPELRKLQTPGEADVWLTGNDSGVGSPVVGVEPKIVDVDPHVAHRQIHGLAAEDSCRTVVQGFEAK